MATKAEKSLLSFKFIATGIGLWFAWKSYQKKEVLAAAQIAALQPQPHSATTPLSIPTGNPLATQQGIIMQAPGDRQLQEAQPTRPMDQLISTGTQTLVQQLQKIAI